MIDEVGLFAGVCIFYAIAVVGSIYLSFAPLREYGRQFQ